MIIANWLELTMIDLHVLKNTCKFLKGKAVVDGCKQAIKTNNFLIFGYMKFYLIFK